MNLNDREGCKKAYFLEGLFNTIMPLIKDPLRYQERRLQNLEKKVELLENLLKYKGNSHDK